MQQINNNFVKKGLILGIIVLFIGASVVPGITGYDKDIEKIDYLQNENETLNMKNDDYNNLIKQVIENGVISKNDWLEQDKLLASDGAAGDEFGLSVSIDGDYAIIGAPYDDDNGDESGSAYVFMKGSGSGGFTLLDTQYDGGFYGKVWCDGTYIYVANFVAGIRAYSFDGTSFTLLATRYDGGTYYNVWGDGNYIYAACGRDGIRAYSFDGTSFTLLAIQSDGEYSYDSVWGDGTYIYVVSHFDGIRAYSFDGTSFTLLATRYDGDIYLNVWGDGTYIYVANRVRGIRAYSFDGTSFTLLATRYDGGTYYNVWGDGNYIYAACYFGGIRAYSFDGTSFTLLATQSDGEYFYDSVWGDGTYIYVVGRERGIQAYSFNDTNFTLLATRRDGEEYRGVWGDGNYVYTACGNNGIRAYSFEDGGPQPPTISFSDINDVTEPERHIFVKNGPPASTTLTINGIASDPDGFVKQVNVKIKGSDGDWVGYDNAPITSWSVDLDVSNVNDGKNTILMTCMDNDNQWSLTVEKTIYINKMAMNTENCFRWSGDKIQEWHEDDYWWLLSKRGWGGYVDGNIYGRYVDSESITEVQQGWALGLSAELTFRDNYLRALPPDTPLSVTGENVGDGFTVDKNGWYIIKCPNIHTNAYLWGKAWGGLTFGHETAKGQYSTEFILFDTTNTVYQPVGFIIVDSPTIGMEPANILENIAETYGWASDIPWSEIAQALGLIGETAGTYLSGILAGISWGFMIGSALTCTEENDYFQIYNANQRLYLEKGHTYIPALSIDPVYARSEVPAGIWGNARCEVDAFTTINNVDVVYDNSNNPLNKKDQQNRGNENNYPQMIRSSNVIVVDDEGDGDYTNIQQAIDNASDGDTILVYSGIYRENITINKKINLTGIPMEFGSGTDTDIPVLIPPLPLNQSDDFSAISLQTSNCSLSGFNISLPKKIGTYGITLYNVSNNNISSMNLTDINGGIRLINSSNNKISHNNILKNSIGISLENSSNNNDINYNILLLSKNGINVESSENNSFKNNSIPFCDFGINIESSSDNSFSTNLLFFNLKGFNLINSSNNKFEDNYISASIIRGIHLVNSFANIILNNSFSYHGGIAITNGHSNNLRRDVSQTIEGNIITNNITETENVTYIYYYYQEDGITVPSDAGQVILDKCTNFLLQGLNLSAADYGVQLISTSNTIISNCTISNNSNGIQLIDSSNNIISNCTIFNNTYGGINFHNSPCNTITDNTFIKDGIVMGGESQRLLNRSINTPSFNWTSQRIRNNTVNGKPLYYYANQSDVTIPTDAGQIILANCSNFTIENTNISMVKFGIQLGYSSDNTILQNNLSNCSVGLSILHSSNNNKIFHNHFINNTLHAYDNCTNTWDNGSSSGGNYWSDYRCIDADSNGIGDTPYVVPGGSNQDRYPLGYFVNNIPVANFIYSPSSPTDMDAIQFNDTSYDVNGSIYSWYWDFGDENTSIHPNPTHQYADNGTYTVNLTVTDEYNISNSTQKTIVISNAPPFADFLYGPLSPTVNDTIYFHDFSYDLDGYIVNWTWNFGDGNISYDQNPVHQYVIIGTYDVVLTVKDDDDGSTGSISRNITVIDGYSLQIIDNTPSAGYTGDPFTFNATVTDNVQVSTVWVEYWYDAGSHTNVSMTYVADSYWGKTIIIDDTLDTMHYIISANDSSNNWNNTGIKDVPIYDNDDPEITNVQAIPSEQAIGGYVNISALVTDNVEIDEAYLYIEYPDSSVENFSITQNKTGNTYYCNKTYQQPEIYTYHIWANDTSGNYDISGDYTFEITTNSPPYAPSDPGPEDGETDVSIDADLSWTGGDPDGDPVTYGVYFGTMSPPPQVAENQTDTLYDPPGDMEYGTMYYWRIISWDNHGESNASYEWHFTTVQAEPDLDCEGSLSWTDVEPGATVEGSFTVENIGDSTSKLDWMIESYPEWGTWIFDPDSGEDLTPEDGPQTVQVEVVAPDEEETEFEGEIKVVNTEDHSDYCIIPVSLVTPVSQNEVNSQFIQFLQRILERFPLLERMFELRSYFNRI